MNLRFSAIGLFLCAVMSSSAAQPSGTLPVITINTDGGVAITSKDNYVDATYSLDPRGAADVEAFSGELEIRGRGNYTWTGFDKKPYRIKLKDKAGLMGMKKSKHFVLLAHADDNLGFLREAVGFKMSELAPLAWTPGMKPVELILNGDYVGLYFLVENIRVDKDRVNIFDQEDEVPSTDVTGGWLCEIDNYDEDPAEQIKLTDGDGQPLRVTHKSPEDVSPEQENWLKNQFQSMDNAIYNDDPSSSLWETYIDKESLARFFIIQEIMDGQESFHGSCYLHRDRGADQKWIWGPVWDFGNTFNRSDDIHIYENPDWGQTWIHRLVKFDSFQKAAKERFKDFVDNDYKPLMAYIDEFAASIAKAAVADAERWPSYGNPDVPAKAHEIKRRIHNRTRFLASSYGVEADLGDEPSGIYLRGTFNGWNADDAWEFTSTGNGSYELRDVTVSNEFKIADSKWGADNWGAPEDNMFIEPEKPLTLVNGSSFNVHIATPVNVKRVVFVKNGDSATVTLTNETSISDIDRDNNQQVTIKGRSVIADENAIITAHDLTGRLVKRGHSTITLSPGLYIITTSTATAPVRVVIR